MKNSEIREVLDKLQVGFKVGLHCIAKDYTFYDIKGAIPVGGGGGG